MLIHIDRARETTTTTGVGNISLLGAVDKFVAFSTAAANLDTINYVIVHRTTNEWEVGLGTWLTGNIIERTAVYSSSNAGMLVNFSTGIKDVFNTITANEFSVVNTVLSNTELETQFKAASKAYYKELTYADGVLTNVDIYVDSSMTVKLFSKELTYTGNDLSSIIITRISDGAAITRTFVYSGGYLIGVDTV